MTSVHNWAGGGWGALPFTFYCCLKCCAGHAAATCDFWLREMVALLLAIRRVLLRAKAGFYGGLPHPFSLSPLAAAGQGLAPAGGGDWDLGC